MSAQAIEQDVTTDAARRTVALPASAWRDALAAVLLSVGKDMTLPVLQTVKVDVNAHAVTLTSTDRYRLTRVTVPVKGDDQEQPVAPFTVLLPTKLVKRMHGIVKAVKVATGEPFTLTHGPALDGVRFAALWSGASVAGMTYTDVYPQVDRIIESAGLSNGTTSMPDRLTVGIDPRYLADLCKMPRESSGSGKSRRPEPVKLSIGDPGKPVLAKWELNGASYTHILMPVRLAS